MDAASITHQPPHKMFSSVVSVVSVVSVIMLLTYRRSQKQEE